MKVNEVVDTRKEGSRSSKPKVKPKRQLDTYYTAPSKAQPFNKPKSKHLS